jgi:H+-translocating NAD(P) transhydrogenase subunit alpha
MSWSTASRSAASRTSPAACPFTPRWLYANNMYYFVENLFKKGIETPDLDDEIVRHTLVTHEGKILYQGALKAMGEM